MIRHEAHLTSPLLALACGVAFSFPMATPLSAARPEGVLTWLEAPAESTLVLLHQGSDLRHPALSRATRYALPTQTLAVVPREDLESVLEADLAADLFEGNPEESEFFLVRALSPDELPTDAFQPSLVDGEVALYHVEPEDAFALGENGAQLERLVWLPSFSASAPRPMKAADPALEALTEQITEDSWGQWVRELSGDAAFLLDGQRYTIASRHVSQEGNTVAGNYLADRLETMGYRPEFQEFTYSGAIERNVLVELPGKVNPKEVIVLGAHFDSTASGSTASAPGADDNGSGAAALLEVARLLQGASFDVSVDLVWFNAEEVGLIGSQEYVRQSAKEGKRITGAVVLDMISYFKKDYALHVEGMVRYRSFMDLAVQAARNYSDLKTANKYYSFGSDHVSFQSANIPAYLLIEAEWDSNPTYHSANDTFDALMPHMGAEATKVALATLASAAGLTLE